MHLPHVARNPNPMTLKTTPTGIDDVQLKEFEDVAVEAASKAGSFVLERITSIMEIKSKTDRPGRDLVTDVDRNSQVIISDIITSRFPDHQFLGEEDQTEEVDPAADFRLGGRPDRRHRELRQRIDDARRLGGAHASRRRRSSEPYGALGQLPLTEAS